MSGSLRSLARRAFAAAAVAPPWRPPQGALRQHRASRHGHGPRRIRDEDRDELLEKLGTLSTQALIDGLWVMGWPTSSIMGARPPPRARRRWSAARSPSSSPPPAPTSPRTSPAASTPPSTRLSSSSMARRWWSCPPSAPGSPSAATSSSSAFTRTGCVTPLDREDAHSPLESTRRARHRPADRRRIIRPRRSSRNAPADRDRSGFQNRP